MNPMVYAGPESRQDEFEVAKSSPCGESDSVWYRSTLQGQLLTIVEVWLAAE